MTSVTFTIPDEIKSKMKRLAWVNWSELVRREVLLHQFLKKFKSKEEQELIKWSVELGRKAKKDSFKKLISELSPKERKEIFGQK
jgi:predicted transcriptional regulator